MTIRLTNGKTVVVCKRTETVLLDSDGNRTSVVRDRHGNLYTVVDRDVNGAVWDLSK